MPPLVALKNNVYSMDFLHFFIRRHFVRKPVLASQKGQMFSQATFSHAAVICQAVVFP